MHFLLPGTWLWSFVLVLNKVGPVKNVISDGQMFTNKSHIFLAYNKLWCQKKVRGNSSRIIRQQKSYYFKLNIKGNVVRVCRISILAVDSLQNERGRLNNILKQIKSWSTPKTDKRGKHCNQFPNFPISNRIPDASIASVHGHIKSIHLFKTHYSGQKNSNKKYFDCDLNISLFYRDKYLEFCKEQNVAFTLEDQYRR